MKRTMKAAVLKAFKQPLTIDEVPIPSIRSNEVLVKVMASGICHTDLAIQDGNISSVPLPFIPGHELAGIVSAVGERVKKVKVGDHVIAAIDVACGSCRFCRIGKTNLCPSLTRIGFEKNGSYGQYAVVPAENLFPIADSVSFEKAALITDSVACMYHAIKGQGNIRGGDRLGILGIGGLGIQGIQIGKHLGAEVFCTSRNDEKLEVARNFGANYCINTDRENVVELVREATKGEMLDVVCDNIGMNGSTQLALDLVRPGGKVIVVSSTGGLLTANSYDLQYYEKEIIGIRASNRQDLAEAIRLVEKGIIDPYLFSVVELEEINMALDRLRKGASLGRTVIRHKHD